MTLFLAVFVYLPLAVVWIYFLRFLTSVTKDNDLPNDLPSDKSTTLQESDVKEEVKIKLFEMEAAAKEFIKSRLVETETETETKEKVTKVRMPEPVKPMPAAKQEFIDFVPPPALLRPMPYYRRFTHGDNDYCFQKSQAAMLGQVGEQKVLSDLTEHLDNRYAILQNLVLKTDLGDMTQIDFVVLSVYGVFVLEVKNYSGWIFGRETDKNWTYIHHQHKYSFMNPLRQNYKHIKALQYVSQQPFSCFQSLIVFPSPNTQFKTTMPSNVVRLPAEYIRQRKNKLFSGKKIDMVLETLIAAQTLQ